MSLSENYPGRNALVSYFKEQKKWSYRGFLDLHRDVIVASSVSNNNWNDLDRVWVFHFLKEAKELLIDQKVFTALREKVKSEHSEKWLKPYWQGMIEEQKKDFIKRKQTVTEDDEKENLEPSRKHLKSIITLICLVKGNITANAFPVDIDSSKLIGHLKKGIKAEKAPEFDNFPADKLKLWKVEIPDDRNDLLSNFTLQDQTELLTTKKVSNYFSEMPAKEYIHIIVLPPESTLRNCINSLLYNHNIDKLCLYIEPKLKELIKKGNLYDDRELVIKVIFHVLLIDDISNHFVDTEVPIKVYEVKNNNILYADLLIVEIKSAKNSKQNRFIFEFKSKGVNFLDLQIKGNNSSWKVMEQKANKVEVMSRSDILQLKCSNLKKFDNGKTMREIFIGACKQLLNYVCNLKKDDCQNNHEFITSAFVIMAVGSRKLIWKKIS